MDKKDIIKLAKKFIAKNGNGLTSLNISNDDITSLLSDNLLKYNGHKGMGLSIIINDETKETKIEKENDREYKIYFITEKFVNKYKKLMIDNGITELEILALRYGSMKILYYSNDMLSYFVRNPRYSFQWRGYRGNIYLKDEFYDEKEKSIYLRDISLGYNLKEKKPVVAILLKDILNVNDKDFINFIERWRYVHDEHFEMNVFNRKNMFGGEWLNYSEIEVYSIIIKGLEILNTIFKSKYDQPFLEKEIKLEDLSYFRPIFNPTSENLYLFIAEIYKFINQNIYRKTFKKLIKKIAEEVSFDVSGLSSDYNNINSFNDEKFQKLGAPSLIDIYFQITENEDSKLKDFLLKLDNLRNDFAHELFSNDYKEEYWKEQDDILRELYIFINVIIVKEVGSNLPEEYLKYSKIFGEKGAISAWSGFNLPAYRFYDGSIRLICETFDSKDSEFLIAFKGGDDKEILLTDYLLKKRPDLDEDVIRTFAKRLLFNEIFKPNRLQILSFFKGQAYISKFFGADVEDVEEKGKKDFNQFIARYSLENTFCFGDSTDPYYVELRDFITDTDYLGKGYMCDIIHDFHSGNYENDNVITDIKLDSDIQILSNIWD